VHARGRQATALTITQIRTNVGQRLGAGGARPPALDQADGVAAAVETVDALPGQRGQQVPDFLDDLQQFGGGVQRRRVTIKRAMDAIDTAPAPPRSPKNRSPDAGRTGC